MLAQQTINTTNCVEAWTRLAGERGGDFFIPDFSDEKVTLVLADAAGHVEEAAAVAEYLRPIITRQIRLPLSESLIRHWHHLVQSRSLETHRFVCLTVLQLDLRTRALTVINAGNPDVLIRRGTRLFRFP